MIASVFANKGKLVEPVFFHATDDFTGLSPVSIEQDKGGIELVRDQWLQPIINSMRQVTRNGTARGVAPRDFQVAMKTGTGGNYGEGFHINYVGFGPVDNPRFSFCVRITNKPRSRDARRAGYMITSRLLRYLREYSGVLMN
jgi:cell division protein FtsI/penicillin-binding protein 2